MEATKSHVLAKVQAERRGLEINLFNLAGEEFDRPGVVGDWSIKDLLANLFEWERLFLHWHDQTLRGIEPQVPCPGISWKDREILNRQIYLKYRNRDPEWVLNKFRATHARFVTRLLKLSDEELFTPGYYPWTEGCPLSSFMHAFAAHNRWARTRIHNWKVKL